MKTKILKIIASSKTNDELADGICELVEERENKVIEKIENMIWDEEDITNAPTESKKDSREAQNYVLKDILDYLHPASPEDSQRDVGKGK